MLVRQSKTRIFKPGGGPAKKAEYESYTSISKFIECPTLYHDHYSRKYREPISKELLFGRAWHALCEDALVEKLWHDRNMDITELLDRWHQRWLIELFLARDDFVWKGDQSPEDYFKTGKLLATTWHRDYLPKIYPEVVEGSFWITLSGVSRAIYGKIDVLTKDGLMIDHKTSSKSWEELKKFGRVDADELDLQMSIYHGGYQVMKKGWPRRVLLHRAVLSDNPFIEVVDLTYTQEQVQKKFDTHIKPTIQAIDDAWKSGVFPCMCGNHKNVKATAPRPVMNLETGLLVGGVDGEEKPTASSALVADKALPAPPAQHIPVVSQKDLDDIPF